MKRRVAPALLALACGGTALAQPVEDPLEVVVVTSSRIEMPLRQVGTSVSVLDEGAIADRGFNSLYNVLRTQPGVSANNAGGAAGVTSLQIRGEDGYRTLVLIDSIDVSDTSGTQVGPRLEHLLSAGVRRVEILRGPQGLMYGADAGGVVDITSGGAEQGFAGYLEGEAGRFGTRRLTGGVSGGNERIDYALSATDFRTDGFNARATDTALRDDDGYDNTTLHGRFGWEVFDGLKLQAVLRDVDSRGDYDGCATVELFLPSDACSYDFGQRAWRVAAGYQRGSLSHELAFSSTGTDRQDYAAGRPSFGSRGERERWSYVGSFDGGDRLRLVYGAELLSDALDDGTFDRDRDQYGYFLEYQGEAADSLFFTAGARFDDNDDFGHYTTWRASAAYLLDLAGGVLKLRGAYGTGFRAPSLYEIAYNEGIFALPPAADISLDAEESEGFDLGMSWYGPGDLLLEVNYFDQQISDVIYFDLVNFSGYLQDRGTSSSRGVELFSEIPLAAALALSANYTWNETRAVDGSTRPRRPEHQANLALRWSSPDGRLMLAAHLRSSYDAVDSDGADMDDYRVVDLAARWQMSRRLSLFGRVENLLDESYREVPTYNTAGAAAYAGFRYAF